MIQVDCHAWVISLFKKQAKKAFPNETLAFMYGQVVGGHIYIDGLWVPEDMDANCTHTNVYTPPIWAIDAIEYAKENDSVVVGTIHSHPWTKEDMSVFEVGCKPCMAQSEADIDSCGLAWRQLSGICLVTETKTGRLQTRVRFWGPTVPLSVKVTKGKRTDA